jgi:hypothetical protein
MRDGFWTACSTVTWLCREGFEWFAVMYLFACREKLIQWLRDFNLCTERFWVSCGDALLCLHGNVEPMDTRDQPHTEGYQAAVNEVQLCLQGGTEEMVVRFQPADGVGISLLVAMCWLACKKALSYWKKDSDLHTERGQAAHVDIHPCLQGRIDSLVVWFQSADNVFRFNTEDVQSCLQEGAESPLKRSQPADRGFDPTPRTFQPACRQVQNHRWWDSSLLTERFCLTTVMYLDACR